MSAMPSADQGKPGDAPDAGARGTQAPPVSVVIPTHNRAAEVQRSIRSVLAQTVPPREIIVVDDGSTDDTANALQVFGLSIRYVRQENRGGGAARNHGVAESANEWIAFLDSDDVWEPDHLERLWAAVEATGGSADLYFDDLGGGFGEPSHTSWTVAGFKPSSPHELIQDGTAWVLVDNHPMLIPASLVRRRAFLEVGGFWEELRTAHDTHFFLKFCIGRPLCAVHGLGARQPDDASGRARLTAATGAVREDRRRNFVRLNRDILERFPHLAPHHKGLLRRRLGAAHRRLSEMAWDRRAYGAWVLDLARALRYDPMLVIHRIGRVFDPDRMPSPSGPSHESRRRA